MKASIIEQKGNTVTLQLQVQLSKSMLESEENIQEALNEAGCLASQLALEQFDTDGSPLRQAGQKWFSKGKTEKHYETPYGEVVLARHVYQTAQGGKSYCPLDERARILVSTTPRFAKMVSHKFATMASPQVEADLRENQHRNVARSYLQRLSDAVASLAQATEERWSYRTPKLSEAVHSVALGLDGTCMLLCDDGYRQAMVGSLSLYDRAGQRQHTIYLGATPEYGKAKFFKRMTQEIEHVKQLYPEATYLGLADGAKDNWSFLADHCHEQILDFYHASSYLAKAAVAAYPRSKAKRQAWLEASCQQLKHQDGAAAALLADMRQLKAKKLSTSISQDLDAAITYFSHNQRRMNYSQHLAQAHPIGSGVTEAACKTLVKQRLCAAGMKWKDRGASMVLSLRALVLTSGRWQQFWSKINQFGVPALP